MGSPRYLIKLLHRSFYLSDLSWIYRQLIHPIFSNLLCFFYALALDPKWRAVGYGNCPNRGVGHTFEEEARMDAASDLSNPEERFDLEVKAFGTAFALR